MSDCHKLSDLITSYCDDNITQEEKALVENHIQTCEKCNKKLEILLKSKQILKDSPAMPVPENLFEDFLKYKENAEKQEKKVVPFYRNYRLYTAIAAVFVFAFVLKSGLLEEDKFMPPQISNQSYQEQTLSASENTQQENVEIAADTTSKTNATKEQKPIPETNTSSESALTTDVAIAAEQPTTENTPIAAASDETDTQTASASGGGSASYARILPEPVTADEENPVEQAKEEIQATIFVSQQFLERATELLGDNAYLLYQAQQKLTENNIPFESNFLLLDESIEYKIIVTVVNE